MSELHPEDFDDLVVSYLLLIHEDDGDWAAAWPDPEIVMGVHVVDGTRPVIERVCGVMPGVRYYFRDDHVGWLPASE